MSLIHLSSRGVLQLTGEDCRQLLQRLITNDITLLDHQPCLYALLLNAQGRFLHDFFVIVHENRFFIDMRQDSMSLLLQRLNLYKLGAKVNIEDVSDIYSVVVGAGRALIEKSILQYADPRHSSLPCRGLIMATVLQKTSIVSEDTYIDLCLDLGIPEEGRGLESGRTIPLEAGIQDLNGISWTKGCYVGQELIARTYHRGEIRKRFFSISFNDPVASIPLGSTVTTDSGERAGDLVFAKGHRGLARLRLTFLQESLFVDTIPLTVSHPAWMNY